MVRALPAPVSAAKRERGGTMVRTLELRSIDAKALHEIAELANRPLDAFDDFD